jgi:two-component system, LytTR family, sensor kinase
MSGWWWIAAIWTGIGLFDGTQTVVVMRAEGMHHAWFRLFWVSLLNWAPWMLATPFILKMGRRYPPTRLRPLGSWARHLGACLTVGVLASAWNGGLDVLLNPFLRNPAWGPFAVVWFSKFRSGLLGTILLYAFVLVIGYALDSRERMASQRTEAARLNEQLSKAQLNALRRQIEPHFLFNTLNAISGLVREKRNDDAVSMIAALSDLLRRAVEDSNRVEVPLAEEMEFVGRYLEIQKMRFADRLQVTMDVPKELLGARVPSLILQPMVENAVKHGIAKRAQGGSVRIIASRANGTLTMKVSNDGPPLSAEWRSGTGISNVRTRLAGLYGHTFEFGIENRVPDGVEVVVSVPYKEG